MTRRVQVGDREVAIPTFSGFKGMEAMAIVARVAEQYPELSEQWQTAAKHYREQNAVRITRAMKEARGYEIADSEFDESGVATLYPEPPFEQLLFAAFPRVFAVARTEVIRLLALIAIPNSELVKADQSDDDDVDGALARYGQELLYEGSLDQLAHLAIASYETLKEGEFLGKLLDLAKIELPSTQSQNGSETSASNSSTESPKPTDGPAEKSSSKSPGRTSKATSAA